MGKVLPISSSTNTTPAPDDQRLMASCAEGDVAALGTLFDQHVTAVRRFVSRFSANFDGGADLDDMVQMTFLEAFRSARNFQGGASVRTWLLGIAVNVSRHRQRGTIRRRLFLTAWARHQDTGRPGPDQLVQRRLLASDIDRAVSELPPKLRAAFLLCDVEELTGQQAAQALGIPPGTVGRHLHEARLRLRAALEHRR